MGALDVQCAEALTECETATGKSTKVHFMYHIIGADGKEYGPVTVEQLKQWTAEHRVDAQTQVREQSSTEWQPLGSLPGFASALAPAAGGPTPSGMSEKAKTSGMAIASLVCGVLGVFTCGIMALVGLILGIVALVKINNSHGRLSGKGMAIGGLVVSGVFILLLPILAAMMLPALAKAKERAQTVVCLNNAKQLGLAVLIYVSDNNGTFPPAETWCDAITTFVGSPKVYQCSAKPNLRCGYAFNEELSGKKAEDVNPQTVMIFESDAGWNASGGRELLAQDRHSGLVIIGFADGSVRQVRQAELSSLRWNP